jgi:two-component SAPR family response regulator
LQGDSDRELLGETLSSLLAKPNFPMSRNGPLIFVDDDAEDQELMMMSLDDLGVNKEIKMFQSAETALKYLYDNSQEPFMIVSDVNMPKMTGIEFKKAIDSCKNLSARCIPFIFLSTSTRFIDEACALNIQGYFEKGNSVTHLNETMRIILNYWDRTRHAS